MREEPQRGRVGPVAVVDDEQERRLAREVGREPVEPVQRRERDALARDPVARSLVAEGEKRSGVP
jgi:hypothetical protein